MAQQSELDKANGYILRLQCLEQSSNFFPGNHKLKTDNNLEKNRYPLDLYDWDSATSSKVPKTFMNLFFQRKGCVSLCFVPKTVHYENII